MNNSLIKIIQIANETQYYNKIFKDKNIINGLTEEFFKSVPILNKRDFGISNMSILDSHRFVEKKHIIKTYRTSGSTGKFTDIYWLNDDYYKSNLPLWRLRYKWYGILPASKCVSFNSSVYNGNRVERAERIKYYTKSLLGFSKSWMNDQDFIDYFSEMERYKPEWLLIQPSTCLRLIEIKKKYRLRLCSSIRYLELNGELATPELEEYIRDELGITVANMYGATEVNAIALECPFHHMHVISDNVYLEDVIINNKHHAVVTSLTNTIMPIIRYDLNDEIELSKTDNTCECGLKSPIVKVIKGRVTDNIRYGKNCISPYVIIYAIEKVNSFLGNPIIQFQLIRNEEKTIHINLIVKDNFSDWKNAISADLEKELAMNIPDMEFNIIFLNKVMCEEGTKHRLFIDNYKAKEC